MKRAIIERMQEGHDQYHDVGIDGETHDVVDRKPVGLQKVYPNFLLIMMHTFLHSLRCDRVSVTFMVVELTLTDFGKNQISIERWVECQNGRKILCHSHNPSMTVQYLSTPRRYLEGLDRKRST